MRFSRPESSGLAPLGNALELIFCAEGGILLSSKLIAISRFRFSNEMGLPDRAWREEHGCGSSRQRPSEREAPVSERPVLELSRAQGVTRAVFV
jgi:hypothetical protein